MCMNCQPLIKAIDRYLKKADEDFEDTLKSEGRVLPEETVDAMNAIEHAATSALIEETEYFIEEIQKHKDLNELMKVFEKIKDRDDYCDAIREAISEQFHKLIPALVRQYVKVIDKDIKITAISRRAYTWIDNWSQNLANLMKLKSHKQIENILKKGLDVGSDISSVTLDILNSGIRNEYYRARTVAVTEILRAHNVAKWEADMQNPSVEEKMWRHTGAHKNQPRENHVAIDGQRVPVNQPFTLLGADGVTYYPMYPADPDLPVGETANCHCQAQSIVNEEILAMPLEARQALQQKIIEEMDDEWEKELDARNRAKAGINVED